MLSSISWSLLTIFNTLSSEPSFPTSNTHTYTHMLCVHVHVFVSINKRVKNNKNKTRTCATPAPTGKRVVCVKGASSLGDGVKLPRECEHEYFSCGDKYFTSEWDVRRGYVEGKRIGLHTSPTWIISGLMRGEHSRACFMFKAEGEEKASVALMSDPFCSISTQTLNGAGPGLILPIDWPYPVTSRILSFSFPAANSHLRAEL